MEGFRVNKEPNFRQRVMRSFTELVKGWKAANSQNIDFAKENPELAHLIFPQLDQFDR